MVWCYSMENQREIIHDWQYYGQSEFQQDISDNLYTIIMTGHYAWPSSCALWSNDCFFCRAAWIDKCRPDVLITESTYATTIRDSKRFVYFCWCYIWKSTGFNSPSGFQMLGKFTLSCQVLFNSSSLCQSGRNYSYDSGLAKWIKEKL